MVQYRVEVFNGNRFCVWPIGTPQTQEEAIDNAVAAIVNDGFSEAQVLERPAGSDLPWVLVWQGKR